MTMALDVGAKQFRSLKQRGSELVARTCPAACCFLPDKPSVRHLLNDSDVQFSSTGEQLVIWGGSAETLSKRCAVKTEHLLIRNPLRREKRSIAEPFHRVISSLLPPPTSPGEICCLGTISDDLHGDWLEAQVVSRGYRIATCSAGMAVVLAELVREQFTGIGLVFGANRSEAVFARAGVEIARCELPRGGNAIDQNIAIAEDRYWWSMSGFRELETDGIIQWKESRDASVLEPADARGERLLNGYHQLIGELCAACETFPKQDMPDQLALVASGGLTRILGFAELLNQHLAESTLPISPGKTRVASAKYTIARGLLIHAELEQREYARAA